MQLNFIFSNKTIGLLRELSFLTGLSLIASGCLNASVVWTSIAVPQHGGVPPTTTPVSLTQTAASGMNLQIPIELTDNGLDVPNGTTQIFDRTFTSFNTADYDGTVTYSLQVMANNSASTSGIVSLVNSGSTVIGSLVIPGSVSAVTFFSTPISFSSSPANLRLQLVGPTSSGDLIVYSAKLIVTQNGASKTRIYIPLMQNVNSGSTPTAVGSPAALASYSGSTPNVGSPGYWTSYWVKPAAGTYAHLDPTTPWQIEAVLASGSGSSVSAGVYSSGGQSIGLVNTTAVTPTLVQSSAIGDGTLYFDSGTTFNEMLTSTGGATAYLYKIGIWVKLNVASSAQILFRLTPSQDLVSIDGANFSNPTYTHIDVGYDYSAATPYLMDCGNSANPSFANCSSEISGSGQTINSSTPVAETSGSFSLTNNGDYVGANASTFEEITAFLAVSAQYP